jgi:DNA polymerase
MDDFAALRLQLDWGVDEILLDAPQDRHAQAVPVAVVEPVPAGTPGKRMPRAVAAITPTSVDDAAAIAAACEDLPALRAALGRLDCALRDTATQLVFGDGAEDARLVMIGDAPGAEEDRSGIAFSGPSGRLLDKMLASIGLDRGAVRLLNTVPWRPPGDRAASETEIALCKPFLERHIALVKPQLVVLLGAVAAKAMLPAQDTNAGISRLRGKWRRLAVTGVTAEIDCLAMYHPASLLRMPSAKRDAWHDLLGLKARLAGENSAV